MSLPTPDDPGRSPVWTNYIVAQAVQASLGQIPEHALAVGVEVAGPKVRLRFQLSVSSEQDEADMADIVSELEALVGGAVEVEPVHEIRSRPEVSPVSEVRWIFLARA